MIREVNEDEYEQLMSLYCQLHETSVPEYKGDTRKLWQRLVNNPDYHLICLLYTSPSPRDGLLSRMPSSA